MSIYICIDPNGTVWKSRVLPIWNNNEWELTNDKGAMLSFQIIGEVERMRAEQAAQTLITIED
jgi:hypothetical protein